MKNYNVEDVQKRLDEAGVKNIKFFWDEKAKNVPRDILLQEAVNLLGSYLDGDCKPLPKFGDSNRK